MEVSYPKTTPSVGRSFSIRFGRKPSLIGLDPEQGTCVHLLDIVLDLTLQMRKQKKVQRPLSRMVSVAPQSPGTQAPIFLCAIFCLSLVFTMPVMVEYGCQSTGHHDCTLGRRRISVVRMCYQQMAAHFLRVT